LAGTTGAVESQHQLLHEGLLERVGYGERLKFGKHFAVVPPGEFGLKSQLDHTEPLRPLE
jgi:hypothetical protein